MTQTTVLQDGVRQKNGDVKRGHVVSLRMFLRSRTSLFPGSSWRSSHTCRLGQQPPWRRWPVSEEKLLPSLPLCVHSAPMEIQLIFSRDFPLVASKSFFFASIFHFTPKRQRRQRRGRKRTQGHLCKKKIFGPTTLLKKSCEEEEHKANMSLTFKLFFFLVHDFF